MSYYSSRQQSVPPYSGIGNRTMATRSEVRRRHEAHVASSSSSCDLSADATLRNANRAARGPFVWQRTPAPPCGYSQAAPLQGNAVAAARTASRRVEEREEAHPHLRDQETRRPQQRKEDATPRQHGHTAAPRGATLPAAGPRDAPRQAASPPRSRTIQGCSHKPPPEDPREATSLGLSLHKQVRLQQEWSPVSMAIKDDNARDLMYLREAGVNLRRVPGQTVPAIHEAAMLGKPHCLRLLVQAFPQALDERTQTNDTPLHLATCQGKTECVRILLEAGANPNVHKSWMETPLYKACEYKMLDVAELLVRHGASVNARDLHGHTPAYEAITRRSLPLVRLLVSAGARLDSRDNYGATPLFVAAQCGVLDVVTYLVRVGSSVETPAQDGTTPLYEACRNGHDQVAAFLVASGADVNRPNDGGMLPLHAAAERGSERLTTMLAASTSRAAVSRSGVSPLHLAAKHNHDEVLGLLLRLGFDPNAQLSRGHSKYYEDRRTTALFFAVSNNNAAAARLLLRAGADPDLDPLQPLLVAVRANCPALAELLLDHGADARRPAAVGRPTAFPPALLFCAADERMLGLLLRKGCDARPCFDCALGAETHRVQFCELLSGKAMSARCGPIVRTLLDFVANVRLCSCILELLWETGEDAAAIRRLAEGPRALVHLCRLRIRSALGRRRLHCVASLPLPPVLQNYVAHAEEKQNLIHG